MLARLFSRIKPGAVPLLLLTVLAPALLAACASSPSGTTSGDCGASSSTPTAAVSSTATSNSTGALAHPLAASAQRLSPASPQPFTIGLTYIPDVQFAPFYVAKELGYYQNAGLDVTLRHHGFTEGEFDALVAGHEDAIFASGDEVLQERSRGVPITYIGQVFTKYPVTLIVPACSPIHSAADLRGHTIGIPGAYGATYIGLLAILQSAGLSKSDVHIQSIGFTQVTALLSNKVDAVMGYVNNEPIQLQKAGFAIRTIPVSFPLISNGLAALDPELQAHPGEIRALVQATLQGVDYTLAHPDQAFAICKKYVPGLDDPTKAAAAQAELTATLPLWKTAAGAKPGYTSADAWQQMESLMQTQGQLSGAVNVNSVFSNAYLPS
ncbi:MAG TPA: ABC transporter substrate-binding protein [Ktedonobacterales bacterium]